VVLLPGVYCKRGYSVGVLVVLIPGVWRRGTGVVLIPEVKWCRRGYSVGVLVVLIPGVWRRSTGRCCGLLWSCPREWPPASFPS
jgi:hypothetical protein